MISIIVISLFIIVYTVQIVYYLYVYRAVTLNNNKVHFNKPEPLSVIISAKDEYENLKRFLPKILNQSYFDFEVIVINDRSADNSSELLRELTEQFSNLNFIDIDPSTDTSGKKSALTVGINSSKNEYLVFIDADCYPNSENWLKKISLCYSKDTELVLGYGAYEVEKGFLNKIIRYETLYIAMQYLSFAFRGFAYMGVGRNLSYKRSLFLHNKGFEGHYDIKSGDDDLFVNDVSTRSNVSFITDPESKTISVPKKTFKEYIIQKRRHLQTGKRYKFIHKLLLGTEIFSRLLFYLFLICLLVMNKSLILVTTLYFIRLLIQFGIIGLFSKKLNEKNILIFIPIFDFLIPILNLYAVVSSYLKRNKEIKWK